MTPLPETHVNLAKQRAGQRAKLHSIFSCLVIYRKERFRPSNLSLQSKGFPWKKSLCLAPFPSLGLKGHSQHTQQPLRGINVLPRALHVSQLHFSEPFQPWRSQAVRIVRWWHFPSGHLRQATCTFSSLIGSAKNYRIWLAWGAVPDICAKSNIAFVDPQSHAKRWKCISFSNAEVVTELLLKIIPR